MVCPLLDSQDLQVTRFPYLPILRRINHAAKPGRPDYPWSILVLLACLLLGLMLLHRPPFRTIG